MFYNVFMARKSFTKRVFRRIKRIISPKDAEEIIKKEFSDSHGNQMNMSIDVKPQSPNKPTIEWNRNYNEE